MPEPEPIVYDIRAPGLDAMVASMQRASRSASEMEASINALVKASAGLGTSVEQLAKANDKRAQAESRAAANAEQAAQRAATAAKKALEAEAARAEAAARKAEELAAKRARAEEWAAARAVLAAEEKAAKQQKIEEERARRQQELLQQQSRAEEWAAAKAVAAAEEAFAEQKAVAVRQAKALDDAATRAELTASRIAVEGTRAYETLIKVGGEYGQMLREGVSETSELAKAWRAGLSPAERTALNLAKMSAATDDVAAKTVSFSLATANATEKLQDQIRRQDTNVGSQNKLSRSLSELLQQQTDAILKGQQMVGALSTQGIAQAKAAETAKDLTLVLRQLEFDTADADKESEQYKTTVAALQQRIKGLALEEERAANQIKKAADAYGKQKQQLDALETAMDAMSIPGAGMVTRFKQMSDSLETVSEHGSPAQASLLKVGIAVGSVGAAGAAAVAGVAAIGAAIVATTAQAADWNKELEKVGLSIEQAPLERYAASIGSVGSVVKAMGVQIAATFGPAIEGAATRIAALGLAGLDAFKNLRQGEDVMTRLARWAGEVLTEALFLPVTAVARLGEAFGELARWAGFDDMAAGAAEFGKIVEGWKVEQAEGVTAALQMMARDAVAPLITITDDYMAQASELVSRQTAVNAAAREGVTAVKAQTAAVQELTIAARDSITTIGETVPSAFREAQQATSGITDEMIKQSNEAANAIAANLAAAAERGRQSWTSSFSSIGDSAGKLSSLIIGYSHKQGDAAMKAAVVAFRVQQAASSASVVVSTYQAFMQALATMPPPASYVAAGAAIAAGVSSLAAIWMQAPPSASGGATSISAPSVGAAGGTSTVTGTKSMPAFKAEQMNEVTGSTVGGKVDTSGLSVQPTVQVTDAYIAPSSSSMQIRTTPGDAVSIERGGAKADRDGAMLRLLQTLIDESRSQGRIMMDMISELQMSRHRREVSVGGVY